MRRGTRSSESRGDAVPFILVIDDEQPFRQVLRRILEGAGHTVWEAGNGKEGLQVFENEPVDLVLSDIYMDPMDGLETIQQLRRREPGVKIVAMSGGASFGWSHLKEARALGAIASLEKPFEPDLLLETVSRLLQASPQPT